MHPPAPAVGASVQTQKALKGWAGKIQADIRQRHQRKRLDGLKEAVRVTVENTSGSLPPEAQVTDTGLTANHWEAVYKALPTGLQNPDAVKTLCNELNPGRLAAIGRGFIGNGILPVSQFEGTSKHWRYLCNISISLTPTGNARFKGTTNATMDHSWQDTGSLADSRAKVTGPTYTAGVTAGHMPGATANAAVAYKNETIKNVTSTKSFGEVNHITYSPGTAKYETDAELRITIKYTKKARLWSKWAQGQAEKEFILDQQGLRNPDRTVDPIEGSGKLFRVAVTYNMPADHVTELRSADVGTDPDDFWV
ncbi:hypothetical protein OG905_09080 [Streptomyces sp. NBC_00322]|uniref:hypothetical protein n=1 Tax=Streptomyces sp. NBC_00322 TaxID=2975712 RepID=UPI002E27DC3F|nr:hypothetical protein [Streptomyces sp. NBC_00322]